MAHQPTIPQDKPWSEAMSQKARTSRSMLLTGIMVPSSASLMNQVTPCRSGVLPVASVFPFSGRHP